jgi:hypothetical protein
MVFCLKISQTYKSHKATKNPIKCNHGEMSSSYLFNVDEISLETTWRLEEALEIQGWYIRLWSESITNFHLQLQE